MSAVELITFTHNNTTYINADFVMKNAKKLIRGREITSTRCMVKTLDISNANHIFARLKNGLWMISTDVSMKFDKVFFTKAYVDTIPEIRSNKKYADAFFSVGSSTCTSSIDQLSTSTSSFSTSSTSTCTSSVNQLSTCTTSTSTSNDNLTQNDPTQNNQTDNDGIPKIFMLNDEQKFRDNSGNIVELETRGSCTVDDILFSAMDVEKAFELDNLRKIILDVGSTYKKYEHYKMLIFKKKRTRKTKVDEYTKKMFLTYLGILKVIFCVRGEKTKKFMKWATETLFTCQMGTAEQKSKLVSAILGVRSQVVRELFKINGAETPCVYLIYIGNAKQLLGDAYSENQILCKYGNSCDMPRRISEHQSLFKKEFSVDIELLCFSIIDSLLITNAETELKDYFGSKKVSYKNMVELFVMDVNDLPSVKKFYKKLQDSYVGQFKSLDIKNNELTERMAEMKHEFEIGALKITSEYEQKLLQKDVIISQKDVIISQKDSEITSLKKDIEILRLQNEFSIHKLIVENSRLNRALETQSTRTCTNADTSTSTNTHMVTY